MTIVRDPSYPLQEKPVQDYGAWFMTRIIKSSFHTTTNSITPATVFTTACALILAEITRSKDVLFGRVVSGRQRLPINCQDVVGPCTNMVPVRIHVDEDTNLIDLLHKVQDQYLNSLPSETLGLEELKQNCTDWSDSTTKFGFCTTYQTFDTSPESQAQDQRVQLEHLPLDKQAHDSNGPDDGLEKSILNEASLHAVDIGGGPEPDGHHIRVSLSAVRRVCGETMAEQMLAELCNEIQLLTACTRSRPELKPA
jgi:hypothetical protein